MLRAELYRINPETPDPAAIRAAAEAIRRGELVVFPTETVYGLAADALNEEAVRRVFEAKGRGGGHPLPVQIASAGLLDTAAAAVPENARRLAESFWPGPLTIVLEKNPAIPDIVTGGARSVGVRIPDHQVALAFLREVGTPVVATSANLSGRDPAIEACTAIEQIGAAVAVVLDSGPSHIGVASTVIDITSTPARILRTGSIDVERIRAVIGEVVYES